MLENLSAPFRIALVMWFSLTGILTAGELEVRSNSDKTALEVFRAGQDKPIVTQHARPKFRPYLHPIVAPDGKGVLTEYSPGHHKHQTGLYWGFTRVNGRDYFHHPEGTYWRRKSLTVLREKGESVRWQTVYDLLDAKGVPVLTEIQRWEMRATDSEYALDLTWIGKAQTEVTVSKYAYGGLFLRMPWRRGIRGDAANASGRINQAAEGQRSVWVDVGMQIDGRSDLGHIAIFDHPKNKGYPLPWRVDGQLGIGPVRARLGDWKIAKGASETIRHRILVYTGKRDPDSLKKKWSEYAGVARPPMIGVAPRPLGEADRLGLLVQALGRTGEDSIRAALMRGMLKGFEGRRSVPAPRGWNELNAVLAKSEEADVRNLASRLSQLFGDKAATERALATVRDRKANVGDRRSALRSLLNQQNKQASALLEGLLGEPALAIDAIRGYSTVANEKAPSILLSRYPKMPTVQQRAVVETLATRRPYAEALLTAVEKRTVPKTAILPHVARTLNEIVHDRYVGLFGELKPVAADREKLLAKYKAMITPTAILNANASRGRVVFDKTCANCHTLYDKGGKIGPDLTGSNRADLDYILLNSVDPSYDVPDAYKTVTVETSDGRVVKGVLAEEDGSRIVLKTVEQPRLVIAKEDIEQRFVSPKSMMPDGQFDALKPQELFDLIKYLRTTQQVEPAK